MAKVTGKVVNRDRGMGELMRMAQRIKLEQPHVVVGITGKTGARRHMSQEDAAELRKHERRVKQRGKSRTNKPERWKPPPPAAMLTGATLVEIGAAHEFGAGVPERSFIRATIDKNQDAYREQIRKAFRATVVHAARNERTWKPQNSVALKRLGARVEGDIKQYIADGIEPPNSPATIARKKSSKPLIDTGQLRASIASEVRIGGSR